MRCHSSLLTLALAVVLLGCTRQTPGKDVILPSGRHIKVMTAGNLYMLKSGEKAWMMRYQSAVGLQDMDALRREAGEVWDLSRADVEKTGLSAAVIMAEEPAPEAGSSFLGLKVIKGVSYNFALTRGADGTWRDSEGRPLAPPDFQRAAALAASRFENGEYAALAGEFHEPPTLTPEQASEDRRMLETAMRLTVEQIGKPRNLAPLDRPVQFFSAGWQGGDNEYWQKLPNKGVDRVLTYRAEFERLGPGLLKIALIDAGSGWKISGLEWGLETSAPDVQAKVMGIMRQVSEKLQPEH